MRSSASLIKNIVLLWLVCLLIQLPASCQALLKGSSSKGPEPWKMEDEYRTVEFRQGSAAIIQQIFDISGITTTEAAEQNPSASSSTGKLITFFLPKKKTKQNAPANKRGPDVAPHHVQSMSSFPLYTQEVLPELAKTWYREEYLHYTDYQVGANSILKQIINHEDFDLVRHFAASFFVYPEMMADLIQAVFKYVLTNASIGHFECLIWFDLLARVTLAGVPESLNQEAEAALQQGLISFLAKMEYDKTFLRPENGHAPPSHFQSVKGCAEVLLSITKTKWTSTFEHLSPAIERIPFAQEILFPQYGLSKPLGILATFFRLIKFDKKLHGTVEYLKIPQLSGSVCKSLVSSISGMATIHATTSLQTKTASIVLLYYVKHQIIGKINWPLHELASEELAKLDRNEGEKVLLPHDLALIRGCLKKKPQDQFKDLSPLASPLQARSKPSGSNRMNLNII